MAKSFSVQMKEILDDVLDNCEDASEEGCKQTARETAQTLKNTSSKKTGEYASGWTSKRLDKNSYVTYNKTMPGLTHLLENGHRIVNKKGEFGRVNGDHKIADAAEEGESLLLDNIMRKLQ